MIKILKKISKRISKYFNFLPLTIIYLFGIGLSAIFGKILGKKFLTFSYKKTSWGKRDKDKNLESMY